MCHVRQETNVCTLCTLTSSSNGCPMPKAVGHWPLKRWRPRFDTWVGHVRFGTDTVAMGQGFLQVFHCSLAVSLHQCSILIFILILLSSGQAGETWGPSSNSNPLSGIRTAMDRKVLLHLYGPAMPWQRWSPLVMGGRLVHTPDVFW